MARGWHQIVIKSGPRAIARAEMNVDPGDPKDFTESIKGYLKDHHLDHHLPVRVQIHNTSGKYLKEVHVK